MLQTLESRVPTGRTNMFFVFDIEVEENNNREIKLLIPNSKYDSHYPS